MPTATATPATASLRWQGNAEATVGQTFDLELKLDSPALLRGLPLDLQFDPKLLALLPPEEGDYFKRDQALTSFSHSVDAAAGRVRIGVLRQQATGVSGQGTVVKLRFRALATGAARVVVERVDPVQMMAGSVRVVPPPAFTVTVR
jgi:general secretion pathway protein D